MPTTSFITEELGFRQGEYLPLSAMAERQCEDLEKVAVVASNLVARKLTVRRYYAKFANEERTQVVFEAA